MSNEPVTIAQGKRPTETIIVSASSLAILGAEINAKADTITAAETLVITRKVRQVIQDLEWAAVVAARQDGASWSRIADLLDITRQAAHTRYADRLPQSLR